MENLFAMRHVTMIYGGGLFQKSRTVALSDFSLTLSAQAPKIITLAGESGSGKTTAAKIALGLQEPSSGEILYKGRSLRRMSRRENMTFRREVQAIFQDPYEVYNPVYKVDHIFKVLISRFHLAQSREEARSLIASALDVVGLKAEEILGKYPHQLSGGQRQRIMTARAFLLKPRLIVADEPVSMVDASLRAVILDIMLKLKHDFGISFLYITHDLSTAYQFSDEIFILNKGEVMEHGNTQEVIDRPQNPYTQLLIRSIPIPDPDLKWEGHLELELDGAHE